jgi:8-oxo-dGTP diphosphatase
VADPVLAAGAVLLRASGEVCLVHRPAYGDWSLPKGKVEAGEHPLSAAVREVVEETGVRGEPLHRLPDVSYVLPDGRPKTVDFWLMQAGAEPAVPIADPHEVDEIAWLTPEAAVARLSYPADRDLVSHAAGLPPVTAVTPLVRHAHAGERKKWHGNDALRPIDQRGQAEAAALGEVLAHFAPKRLFAATPLRCKQTLEPLAERLGLPIVLDAAFAEPAEEAETPDRVRVALARLADLRSGPTAVACSQGKLMPHVLATLAQADDPEDYRTPKGSGWVISWSGETAVGVSRL